MRLELLEGLERGWPIAESARFTSVQPQQFRGAFQPIEVVIHNHYTQTIAAAIPNAGATNASSLVCLRMERQPHDKLATFSQPLT